MCVEHIVIFSVEYRILPFLENVSGQPLKVRRVLALEIEVHKRMDIHIKCVYVLQIS